MLSKQYVIQNKMGSSSSKSGGEQAQSKEMVLYDKQRAKEAIQHTNSDFVDPSVLVDYLRPGDMIQKKGNFILQWFYSHFAIYIGNGEIVHVAIPNSSGQGKTVIRRAKMKEAFRGELVRKNNHLDNAPKFCDKIQQPHKIVKAARDRDGEEWDYKLMTHNCEHFATWCRYGREVSLQSWAVGDLMSGKITFWEYFEHSFYSIKEKITTLISWMKRNVASFVAPIG